MSINLLRFILIDHGSKRQANNKSEFEFFTRDIFMIWNEILSVAIVDDDDDDELSYEIKIEYARYATHKKCERCLSLIII